MAHAPVSFPANPLKRAHDDAELELDRETSGQPRSSPETVPSPGLSALSLKPRLASPDLSSLTSPPASPAALAPPNVPPAKRQKLSPQEKAAKEEQKRKDKEAKEQLRAQKAEETRKKAEQREAKKREKEVEKQQKEHATQEKKRQKELEQEKIERSQSRLTKFLVGVKTDPAPLNSSKPSVAVKSPTKHNQDGERSRSMSIDTPDSALGTPVKHCMPKPDACTEYGKVFLPFNLPSSTTMPSGWLSSDGSYSFDCARLDSLVSSVPEHPPTLEEHISQYKRRRGKHIEPVKDLIAKMEAYHTGSAELNIGDLSNSHIEAVSSALTALSVLSSIAVKYLHFEEDVRPPYCGTWTKFVSDQQMRSVARNATTRIIEDINYDYDSEAEWAEPGEGDDVDSDGEEDAESEDGEDDMDGFLDDENDSCVRRNIGLVNSEVQCSGLQWESSSGHSVLASCPEQRVDLAVNRVGFIIDPPVSAFKPYGSTYWGGLEVQASGSTKNGPSRIPLALKPDNFGNTLNVPNLTRRVGKPVDEVSKLLIPFKDLERFKKAIVGRQETKQDLTKELHKMFPKYSKEMIGTTLSTFASRSTVLRKWFLMDIPNELILDLFDKMTPGSKTQQTLLPSGNA